MPGLLLPFDHLVLALGSVPNFLGLPGVAAHALTMESLADASAPDDILVEIRIPVPPLRP